MTVCRVFSRAGLMWSIALLLFMVLAPAAHAAGSGKADQEFDSYEVRFGFFWFCSKPSGSFTSAGNAGVLDLQKDIGFNSYSTFFGKLDWKFTHKNHLYLIATRFTQNKQVVLAGPSSTRGRRSMWAQMPRESFPR